MQNQKGFILPTLIIISLLILAIIAYISSSKTIKLKLPITSQTTSNDQSQSWKTHVDNQNSFSIDYPNDWDIRLSKDNGALLSISSSKYPTHTPGGNAGIYFYTIENKSNLKLMEWVKKYGHNQGKLPPDVYSVSNINNIPVVEINYTWTQDFIDWLNKNYTVTDTEGPPSLGTKFREVYVQKKDGVIMIQTSFLPLKEEDTNFFSEVDRILSTFRFLN